MDSPTRSKAECTGNYICDQNRLSAMALSSCGTDWLQVKYLYVELVRAMHSTTKTILAHFHYGLKGQIPFQQDFDWKGSAVRRMADLDQDQVDFMQDYTRIIQQKSMLSRIHPSPRLILCQLKHFVPSIKATNMMQNTGS